MTFYWLDLVSAAIFGGTWGFILGLNLGMRDARKIIRDVMERCKQKGGERHG